MTIDELYKIVSVLENKKNINKYLECFNNIYWSLSEDEKQSELDIISKVFFLILKNFQYMPSEDETNKISELISSIAVTQITSTEIDSFISGEYEFFKFLKNLTEYKTSESVNVYKQLGKDISEVDWIFSLSKNNELIYPLGSLMNDVINNSHFDIRDLFNLSFLLRIYVKYEIKDINITDKIIKLIKEYNLKCLEYIRQGGEQLLTSQNVNENGTMIFRLKNKVLIRNINRDYFDTKENVEEERDNKGNIIAYFIQFNLPPDTEEFYSLTKFLQEAKPNDKKFKFIQRMYKEKHFNNFFNGAIYFDNEAGEYEFLNQYSSNDKKICISIASISKKYSNTEEGFYRLLTTFDVKFSLRQSIIWCRNSFDILTLDFFSELTRLNKESIDFKLEEISESDFLQNSLLKQYLERVGNLNIDEIINYLDFITEKIFDLNNPTTTMKEGMKLIMPYRMYTPEFFSDVCYIYKHRLEDIEGEFCQFQIGTLGLDKYVEVDGKRVIVKDIEKEVLNTSDLEEIVSTKPIKKGFFDQKEGILYYDTLLTSVTDKIIRFNENVNKYFLTYDLLRSKNTDSLNKLIELIKSIKLSRENYTSFGVDPLKPADSIVWYKLMWHFTLLQWNSEQIDSFLDLILKRHYTGCALEYQDTVSNWYHSVDIMISDKSNLVFTKEKKQDTTLDNYIAEISTSLGGKQAITQTDFDQSKVRIENNKFYYKEREINKIVILVDNIMGGSSLGNALRYYFGKNFETDVHDKYFPYSTDLKNKGLRNLNVEVIIKAIWSFPDVISNTKSLNEDSYKLSIEPEKIIDDYYKCNDDVIRITKSLYRKSERVKYLIFRQKNMPLKSVFPKEVTDTTNLIGLFNRSKELG